MAGRAEAWAFAASATDSGSQSGSQSETQSGTNSASFALMHRAVIRRPDVEHQIVVRVARDRQQGEAGAQPLMDEIARMRPAFDWPPPVARDHRPAQVERARQLAGQLGQLGV